MGALKEWSLMVSLRATGTRLKPILMNAPSRHLRSLSAEGSHSMQSRLWCYCSSPVRYWRDSYICHFHPAAVGCRAERNPGSGAGSYKRATQQYKRFKMNGGSLL
ncbi:hypothetical protein AOLI_G00143750 [Acnodon oligacanthus]